jgi:preprotein translocase subunit SecG
MYVSELNVLIAQSSIGLGLCQLLLFLVSLFLILLVLVQRGKGGGLTGALGGMGGQSAFGTKAGDAFTRITIITTLIWITLCMITISRFNPPPAARVTKEMTLMEKARALDYAPSIGAPAEPGDVPSDFKGDAAAEGESSGVTADDDNVAVKQTPENTAGETAEAAESESTDEASADESTAEEASTEQE